MAATTINSQEQQSSDLVKVGFSDLKQGESSFWNYESKLFSSSAHQGSREYMEDRTLCLCDQANKFSIFSVFDGHGGDFVSDFLEKNFTDRLRHRLLNTDMTKSDALKDAVTNEIHQFDKDMEKVNPDQTKEAGSTLTSVLVYNNKLYVIQIGDSKAVACDSVGNHIVLTKEHKPSNPQEKNRIIKAGGHIENIGVDRVEGVLAVSRAVGDCQFKGNDVVSVHPDIVEIDLTKDSYNYIIIGSDGLFDVVPAKEAIEFANAYIKEHGIDGMPKLANALCQEALNRKSQDNVSVIVVKLML
uniref:PPM-type phosphatase domain-containing protein n=1 Tax=Panagrolaimus davidi TaxID=227884 RepID=A0A914QH69_9BILA